MESRSLHASPQWPWLAASAVLPSFNPERLVGVGRPEKELTAVLEMMMDSAEPVDAGPAKGQWRLREEVRRRVLATFSSRDEVRGAIQANASDYAEDLTTRALLELVDLSPSPRLAGRTLNDLLALDQAVEWLDAASVRPLPSRADILARIQREKFLEPMRRLVVGFEGRDDDLRALRAYVDTLPPETARERLGRSAKRLADLFRDHPPFMIHGPGGAGKSTLIAKFILDHTDRDSARPMGFVLLDFDRSTLDPRVPATLLIEIVSQLRLQFPEHAERLTTVEASLDESIDSEDGANLAMSAHYDKAAEARDDLARIMREIAKGTGQNLLFVVDTFEIVQRRGSTAVFTLLDFLGRLLAEVRRLRVVIVGRAELQRSQFGFTEDPMKWQSWPLKGFDIPSGRAYLRERLKRYKLPPASDADLDRLVRQARGNPLCLRLAAQVFAREGVAGVDAAIGISSLDDAIAEEQLQGMLHERIIEHLENEDLKKIANPGLIIRRITPEVIEEVLAVPCEIDLAHSSVEFLFSLLKDEFSLVEIIDGRTVRHRPDVRQLMLSSLRRELGSVARRIDDLAVDFWGRHAGPAERAEEIYHRLWRNDSQEDLDRRWIPDVGEFLSDAWDEFQTVAIGDWPRIWLSEKLGRELPDELRLRADQVEWERDIERKARTLLTDAKPDEALRVLAERPHDVWLPASPLWILEIDALMLRGDPQRALVVIDEGISRLEQPTNAHALLLLARRVGALERLEQLESATQAAGVAVTMARATRSRASIFSCGITRCRLAERTGDSDDPAIVALRKELSALATDPAVKRLLAESPALLRESIAVLGVEAPTLIADALERFSVPPGSEAALRRLYAEIAPNVRSGMPGDAAIDPETNIRHSLASLVRQGRVEAGTLDRIARQYSELSDRLATQVLKRR